MTRVCYICETIMWEESLDDKSISPSLCESCFEEILMNNVRLVDYDE